MDRRANYKMHLRQERTNGQSATKETKCNTFVLEVFKAKLRMKNELGGK